MDFSKYKIKKIKNKTFYQGRNLTILDITRKDKKKIKVFQNYTHQKSCQAKLN